MLDINFLTPVASRQPLLGSQAISKQSSGLLQRSSLRQQERASVPAASTFFRKSRWRGWRGADAPYDVAIGAMLLPFFEFGNLWKIP